MRDGLRGMTSSPGSTMKDRREEAEVVGNELVAYVHGHETG